MTVIKFSDRLDIGATKETTQGYLVATARVARTGNQIYLARELGHIAIQAGFAPNDQVRVHRHADQVFAKDSLASITRVPVTINHPKDDVDAANWGKLSVGDVGDAYTIENDQWIVVNPMLKDASAVTAARTTHRQISMGYSAGIVTARDGLDADFEMIDIRYNHLALVPEARAGDMARIGDAWGISPVLKDSQPGIAPTNTGGDMNMKVIVLGDKAVQVADADVAEVERYKASMAAQLADAKAEKKKSDDEKDAEIGELKAKLKKAEDSAANLNIDAMVSERSALLAVVAATDANIVTDGKSNAELRKAVVVAKMGDAMVKDVGDAQIEGMFKICAKDANTNPVQVAIQQHAPVQVGDAQKLQDAAQNSYVDRLTRKTTGA